jgi:hypothetical protein
MKRIALILLFSAGLFLYAEAPEKVHLLNTGKMHIAPSEIENETSMYVVSAVRCISDANIILNGILKIGGNFVQDSDANVFQIGNDGYTTSVGKMVFTDEQDVARYIKTTDFNSFNRGAQYIAFPNIEIETTDTIVMPSKMGIDALSVKRSDNSMTGFILLKSDATTNDEGEELVYDASLRITTIGNTSENLVDIGTVIVEQYMGAYRSGTQLFPFASPYKNTQLSGYFAGNWVRRLLRNNMFHTTYVLGNKPSANNADIISADQYVINPMETLKAGIPYLIKPRPAGFNYADLKESGGLKVTGAEAGLYDQEKFIFNGDVYEIIPYQEQLFAEDVLFSYTFNKATTLTSTLNWVIGNSYTSPISVSALKEEIENSALFFAPYIYVYNPGSTSYQSISISEDGINSEDADEIPAKSIFMIRVSKNQGGAVPAGTKFEIGKKHLHHGNLSHNLLKAKTLLSSTNRDISFRITLAENPNIYDLTAIGLRETASLDIDKYDIPKIYIQQKEGFQLYTKTLSGSKLTSNGVPPDADSVKLSFKPQSEATKYTLNVSQKGNEGELWLKDLKTNIITNLRHNPSYTFNGIGTDLEDRFIVYFNIPEGMTITSTSYINNDSDIYVEFLDDRLRISGLIDLDMNSKVYIYDILGKMVFSGIISQFPQQEFSPGLRKNVYIVSIQGQRNFNLKIIK